MLACTMKASVASRSWHVHSLPQRQHLLLVSRLAVRLHERARSGGQQLLLTPGHVLHLSGDDVRYVPHPTFFDIQRQNSYGSIVLPPQQITDDGRGICFRRVSLDISLTGPTEVTKDEVQVLLGHKGYRAHDAVLCVG